jgi:hypothetical protein
MAKSDPLPDQDEVTRWIKPKLLGRDDDDNVIVDDAGQPTFVFPTAFEMRDDEDSLSVTWLQHFAVDRAQHLPMAAEAVRETTASKKLQPKSAFAIAKVEEIKEIGAKFDLKLRILEDPVPGNSGHSEIRRYPREMGDLQAILAAETFAERYLYGTLKQAGWAP